jgi:hypothetical protein
MRELADRPEEVPAVFAERFNSGDPTSLAQVYEDTAVMVPQPGTPVTGPDLHATNGHLQKLGAPISVRPRHVYRNGDPALLIVGPTGMDRSCTSRAPPPTSPDGVRTVVGGTSSTTPSAPVHSNSSRVTPQDEAGPGITAPLHPGRLAAAWRSAAKAYTSEQSADPSSWRAVVSWGGHAYRSTTLRIM